MPVEALALERTLSELDHARLSSLLRSDSRRAGALPHREAIEAGLVSVLSPVRASLLGLTPGCVAHWSTPGGAERQAEIVTLQFQPEADGDYLK